MKNNVMPSIVQIEAKDLKKLVSEIKETVATGVLPVRKAKLKVFGVVDLWNVRRKMKTASLGRRAF